MVTTLVAASAIDHTAPMATDCDGARLTHWYHDVQGTEPCGTADLGGLHDVGGESSHAV